MALQVQEPEQRAQARHGDLGRTDTAGAALGQHELADPVRVEAAEVEFAVRALEASEESFRDLGAVTDRARRQPPLA